MFLHWCVIQTPVEAHLLSNILRNHPFSDLYVFSGVSVWRREAWGAMMCTTLEKRLIAVRMVVLLSDVGRPVMNSRALCDQGRLEMGRGSSRPERGRGQGFIPGAGCTRRNERVVVCIHGGPPESLADEVQSVRDAWVAGKPGGTRPVPWTALCPGRTSGWGDWYQGLANAS